VDWDTYPILKFAEVPEVEVVLINRPNERAVGAGEPATITTAAAVANAIYDATGARVRQVPFRPERIKAALHSPS
jgi:CO/xanthine dehydrogenase Mo-binding subunit